MKKLLVLAIALALVTSPAIADTWNAFVVRNAGTDNSSPDINDVVYSGVAAKEFATYLGGQKAAWGTSDLDGATVGQITKLAITRLDDYTRFAAGSGAAVAPYFNMWITDGAGNYAVIANEPSNAEWQPGNTQWDIDGATLSTKTVKVYENSDLSWLPNSGVGLTFADLAGYTIEAPSVADLTAGWAGLGTGAPRELGTNIAYGFNWVFGDTLSNYLSGDDGFVVADPTARVPSPGAATLAGIGLALIGLRKRSR